MLTETVLPSMPKGEIVGIDMMIGDNEIVGIDMRIGDNGMVITDQPLREVIERDCH